MLRTHALARSRDVARGAYQAWGPVAVPQGTHRDAVPLVHRVDELSIADLDTHLAHAAPIRVGKNQDVPGRQVVRADGHAPGALAGCVVR